MGTLDLCLPEYGEYSLKIDELVAYHSVDEQSNLGFVILRRERMLFGA